MAAAVLQILSGSVRDHLHGKQAQHIRRFDTNRDLR